MILFIVFLVLCLGSYLVGSAVGWRRREIAFIYEQDKRRALPPFGDVDGATYEHTDETTGAMAFDA